METNTASQQHAGECRTRHHKQIRIYDLQYENSFVEKFLLGAQQILREGHLANHTFVEKFEQNFASFNGSRIALAVNNGTGALEIALRALRLNSKIVILPTNTFIACTIAINNAGGIPYPLDIEADYHSLCPIALEAAIKTIGAQKIGAIMQVHIGGHISPYFPKTISIAQKYNIPIIEDCSHAHGAELNGIRAGNFGLFGCFSFHTTKVLPTGEGGMVVSNQEEYSEYLQSIRRFGMDIHNPISHVHEGNNFKLGEFQALLGILELERIQDRILQRRKLAARYQENLKNLPFFCVSDSMENYGVYYKQIIIPQSTTREKIEIALRKYNIPLTGGVYYIPLHKQPVLESLYSSRKFPKADFFCAQHFCPPCYPELKISDIDYICKVLSAAAHT